MTGCFQLTMLCSMQRTPTLDRVAHQRILCLISGTQEVSVVCQFLLVRHVSLLTIEEARLFLSFSLWVQGK